MRVGIQVYLFGRKLLLTFFIQRLQTFFYFWGNVFVIYDIICMSCPSEVERMAILGIQVSLIYHHVGCARVRRTYGQWSEECGAGLTGTHTHTHTTYINQTTNWQLITAPRSVYEHIQTSLYVSQSAHRPIQPTMLKAPGNPSPMSNFGLPSPFLNPHIAGERSLQRARRSPAASWSFMCLRLSTLLFVRHRQRPLCTL